MGRRFKGKYYGMSIEVVEQDWLPDGAEFMVFEEGATHPDGRTKKP